MIKGLRKSIKEKRITSQTSSISSPIQDKTGSIQSVDDIMINNNHNILQSPKKVIKALYDYKPQGPGELEFQKGDFFHVIGNEDDSEWYEACNPHKNIRGMVPVPYFEVFGKTRPLTNPPSQPIEQPQAYQQSQSYINSHNNNNNHRGSNSTSNNYYTSPSKNKKLSIDSYKSSRSSSNGTSSTTLYAIVLYDFKAERSDELDIHIGENIILCAHHNYEWFIAKPIDRLGGPGLVPVGYVSVIDIVSGASTGNDVVDDINGANLPTVEEWKNKNAKYKASSIPLGNVEENEPYVHQDSHPYNQRSSRITSNSTTRHRSNVGLDSSRKSSGYNNNNNNSGANNHGNALQFETNVDSSTPYILEASVDSFHVDNGRYWFHVETTLSNGEIRSLCRYYEDFYDFQIRLLELFPDEAGRSSEHKRILPFIPGPLTYVTDKITKKRQIDLNDYVQELIRLPDYISTSNYVKNLFELKNDLDHVLDVISNFDNLNLNNNDDGGAGSTLGPIGGNGGDETLIKEESVQTLNASQKQSVKLKFYYKDDIFALLISNDINLDDLKIKISKRIYDLDEEKKFKLYINDSDKSEISNDDELKYVLQQKVKILIDDD